MNQTVFADREVDALLRTGLSKSREEVISDAIRNLLLNNKSLRLELAIDLFRSDEVSLGRAAEIAGIDRWDFQDIRHERQIPIIIEAESAEAIDKNIARFFGRVQSTMIVADTSILSTFARAINFLRTTNAPTIFASPTIFHLSISRAYCVNSGKQAIARKTKSNC
jgi:predicted HTH domain antitoxin